MKISNLIKIILLSTILQISTASAGLFDGIKKAGEAQKYKKECEKGDAKSCMFAGMRFEATSGESAAKEAVNMHTKGCELGNGDCCSRLFQLGEFKALVVIGENSKDQEIKKSRFWRACKGGELKGCEYICINNWDNNWELDGCMKLAEEAGKKNPSAEGNDEQIKWWLKACENGNKEGKVGCTNAGLAIKDPAESSRILQKGCDTHENARPCNVLGFRAREKGDLQTAARYYELACNWQKFEDSCESLKEVQREIAEINNKKLADQLAPQLANLKTKCDSGDLKECINYGLLWPVSADQKNPWFRKACDGGLTEGCFQMGRGFQELNNLDGAINLFIKACNGNHLQGCFQAGDLCSQRNRPADAKKYLLLGCDGGHPLSCNNLGAIESKKGNKAEAVKFYIKACSGGNTAGCNNLAGIQIDWNNIAEARKYLNEGCDAGSNAACQKLTALTKAGM